MSAKVALSAIILSALAFPLSVESQTFAERFDSWRSNSDPSILSELFRDMPLGGELHTHLSGAIQADVLVEVATANGYRFAFDQSGNFQGFALPDPRLPLQNKPTYLQGRCWLSVLACKSGTNLSTSDLSSIHAALTIDRKDMKRNEAERFADFNIIFQRVDDLTDNTDVIPLLIQSIMDSLSAIHVAYVELKLTPYGRSNSLGETVDVEHLLINIRAYINQKNQTLRGNNHDTVVVKIIAQLDRTDPLRSGGPSSLPYISCSSNCPSRLRQAHYLASPLSPFAGFVVSYDYLKLPEVDFNFGTVSFGNTVTHLTTEFGDVSLTLHAGESVNYQDHIERAISVGADRIGHGFNLPDPNNSTTRRTMCTNSIPIEVSISSNVLLGLATDAASHPMDQFLKTNFCSSGGRIPLTLNTDDAGIFRTDMAQEFCIAARAFDLDWNQVKRIARASLEYAFAPQAERTALVSVWDSEIARFEQTWSPPNTLPSARCAVRLDP